MTLSYLGLVTEFMSYPVKIRFRNWILVEVIRMYFDIVDLVFRIKSITLTTRPHEISCTTRSLD